MYNDNYGIRRFVSMLITDLMLLYLLDWDNELSYRSTKRVKRCIEYKGDVYPLCPTCNQSFEREYMAYCSRCGQKLGWRKYEDVVKHQLAKAAKNK